MTMLKIKLHSHLWFSSWSSLILRLILSHQALGWTRGTFQNIRCNNNDHNIYDDHKYDQKYDHGHYHGRAHGCDDLKHKCNDHDYDQIVNTTLIRWPRLWPDHEHNYDKMTMNMTRSWTHDHIWCDGSGENLKGFRAALGDNDTIHLVQVLYPCTRWYS